MSDTSSPFGFELVRRGYDRGQVDDRITKLVADRDSALARINALEKRIEELHLETQNAQAQVNDAFLQVSAAQQRAQSAINNSRAYAQQVTQGAQGAAAQFERIYAQYRLAPDVTRRRMYYETMEQILQQVDTTVVEAPGVQPYLPLPQVQGSRALPAAPAQGAGR